MIEGVGVKGILVTHGGLGAELLKTAESILGVQEGIAVISNTGRSSGAVEKELERLLSEREPVVLFVDLAGGSCGHVCAMVRRNHPEVFLVRGVNLPMLLEFLHHRRRDEPAELKDRLLRRARAGIECVGWESERAG